MSAICLAYCRIPGLAVKKGQIKKIKVSRVYKTGTVKVSLILSARCVPFILTIAPCTNKKREMLDSKGLRLENAALFVEQKRKKKKTSDNYRSVLREEVRVGRYAAAKPQFLSGPAGLLIVAPFLFSVAFLGSFDTWLPKSSVQWQTKR